MTGFNPFAVARSFGYNEKAILAMASSAFPGYEDNIKAALLAGFSPEKILNFITSTFNGTQDRALRKKPANRYEEIEQTRGQRGSEVLSRLKYKAQHRDLDSLLNPAKKLLGLGAAVAAGTALPGLLGTAAGAVGGAAADALLGGEEADTPPPPPEQMAGDDIRIEQPRAMSVQEAQAAQPQQEMTPSEPVAPPQRSLAEMTDPIRRSKIGWLFGPLAKAVDSEEKFIRMLDKRFGNTWRSEIAPNAEEGEALALNAYRAIRGQNQPASVEPTESPSMRGNPQENIIDLSQDTDQKRSIPELFGDLVGIGSIKTERPTKLSRDVQPLKALESSNVRYADYDPETSKLQVLFSGSKESPYGKVYEYWDVPEADVSKMLEGAGVAKTTGRGAFRAWFKGKDPSIGAAFNEFIKRKDERGDFKYPYRQISEDYVKDPNLIKLRKAEKVGITVQAVDAFEDLVLKAQAKQQKGHYKEMSDLLQTLPDDVLESIIFDVTKAVAGEKKSAKSQGKRKSYKGGIENEIASRIMRRASGVSR